MTRPAAEGLTPEEWAVKAACGACMHHKPCMEARVVLFRDAMAQGRAEGLESARRIVAHFRAYYGEDIFAPDGTSPECGHAKWARNLLDGITHETHTLLAAGEERTE